MCPCYSQLIRFRRRRNPSTEVFVGVCVLARKLNVSVNKFFFRVRIFAVVSGSFRWY